MKILISTPCYNGMLNCHMVQSLIRAIESMKDANHSVNWHTPVSSILSYNRNLAVDIAIAESYDWLLFWDGDISIASATFWDEMIKTAYKFDATIVGLPVALKGHPIAYNFAEKNPEGYYNYRDLPDKPREIDVIGTGVMLIDVDAVKEKITRPWFNFIDTQHGDRAGFFPEDWNLCEKVKAAGGKISVDPRFSTSHWGTIAFK